VILIKAVFMLYMDRVGVQFFDKVGHGFPPGALGHIDDRMYAVARAVGVGNDEDLPLRELLHYEFTGLFGESAYTAETGRVTGDYYNGLCRHVDPSLTRPVLAKPVGLAA
jgi:hypothetical protein